MNRKLDSMTSKLIGRRLILDLGSRSEQTPLILYTLNLLQVKSRSWSLRAPCADGYTGGINANRWPGYLRDIFRAVRPGGWAQLVEIYFQAQSDNGTLTEGRQSVADTVTTLLTRH